jgi:competence protein ComEA
MKRQYFATFLVGLLSGLLAAGLVLLFISRPKRYPIRLLPPPTSSPLRVHITGAVLNPGVYSLPADSIWESALHAAGGVLAEANLDRINLAAPLEEGQHIFIPYLSTVNTSDTPVSPTNLNSAAILDINHATAAELEQLPGIGSSLAKSIIIYREEHGLFLEPEDLLNVSGIGPSKLAQIRELITCQ